ncbi:MAG: citrate/2-methylcitrate synthase [Chloroflexota bacterium]
MSTSKGGLEGVVAGTSSVCEVDGIAGRLSYRGVNIHELAANSSFEETAYLLWYSQLPTRNQLRELEDKLSCCRDLPHGVLRMIVDFPDSAEPMMVLRTAVSAMSMFDPGGTEHHHDVDLSRAILLTSRVPTILTAHHRARQKLDPIPPRRDLGLAANLLYMLKGEIPSKRAAKILDSCLILHADHELNASTFAGRVAAATLSDLYSSVTAAIGTLAGPLHGGANEQVMQMLRRIGDPSKAEDYVAGLLEQGKKVPGFGHRVYRTEDPRAYQLRKMSEAISQETGETRWYEMSRKIEEFMIQEKAINANVDFYSASVYHGLGIPIDLFTPVFAASRMVGWTAHILEQYSNHRLIRPRAEYTGARDVAYVPIDDRLEAAPPNGAATL